MFARMATFSVKDPNQIGDMADRIRDAARPIVESLPGWQGATQMLDRQSGKLAVIHLFDTEEHMQAAEETFETLPSRLPEDLQQMVREIASGRQSVERYEVLGDMRVSG